MSTSKINFDAIGVDMHDVTKREYYVGTIARRREGVRISLSSVCPTLSAEDLRLIVEFMQLVERR